MMTKYSFLNKKIVLILLIIISVIFNIMSYRDIQHKERYVDRYYEENIDNAILSIHQANQSINNTIILEFSEDKRARELFKCSSDLKSASKFLQLTSVYFEYSQKRGGVKGNVDVYKFFEVYTVILEDWADAIYNDSKEQPTTQDLKDLEKDLQNMFNKFDNIKYELTYEKLNLLIEDLVDETITKDIKKNLNVLFSRY